MSWGSSVSKFLMQTCTDTRPMASETRARTARFFNTLQNLLLSVPLQLKIIGMAVGLTYLVGAVTTYQVHKVLNDNMNTVLEMESRSFAAEFAGLSASHLLINDLYGLSSTLKSMALNRPDLRYTVVLDARNNVLAHTFEGGFPGDLLRRFRISPKPLDVRVEKISTNEGIIWEAAHPIMQGEIGSVRVGLSTQRLQKRNNFFVQTLVLNIVLVGIAAIVVSGYLTWLITRPVNDLIQATKRVREGDYSVQFPSPTSDELGWLIKAFSEMVQQLHQAEKERLEKEQMRRDLLQRIIITQENERKRISRELHDQTGQALASLMVTLKLLENAENYNEAKKGLTSLKAAINREMEAIHGMAVELRPSVLDDLGLVPALELYLNDFEAKHSIGISFVTIGFEKSRPDACIETCIYRIIQESLTNVLRHARATSVSIILEWDKGKIRGIIEDDGIGFETGAIKANPARLGIYGMEERALLLGGSFRIESEPEQGTMIIFEIPSETGDHA
jgi:signal transduction histidine kinase